MAEFDIHAFTKLLKDKLPFKIDVFLPSFSNSPKYYNESMCGLFAEMVKNYYSCSVCSCSIPKVRLYNDKGEWTKIIKTLNEIEKIFNKNKTPLKYLQTCISTVNEFIANLNNASYWNHFFEIERCGSGGEQNILGHVLKLLSQSFIKTTSLPKMISRYPFVNLNLPKGVQDCNFISGIMYSNIDQAGILVPQYHCNITYIDESKCKLNDSEIKDKHIILRAQEILSQYDGTYDSTHAKILPDSYSQREDFWKKHEIPSFEKYKKDYRSWGRSEELTEKDYKEAYEKQYADYKYHNSLVDQCNKNLDKYYKQKNNDRLEKLKTHYSVWLEDQKDVVSKDYYWYYSHVISSDRLKNVQLKYVEHERFMIKNMKVIAQYIGDYHCNELVKKLLKMRNLNVIIAYLNEYQPYEMHLKEGYSSSDLTFKEQTAKINTKYNFLVYLLNLYVWDHRVDHQIRHDLVYNIINYENHQQYHENLIEDYLFCLEPRLEWHLKDYDHNTRKYVTFKGADAVKHLADCENQYGHIKGNLSAIIPIIQAIKKDTKISQSIVRAKLDSIFRKYEFTIEELDKHLTLC